MKHIIDYEVFEYDSKDFDKFNNNKAIWKIANKRMHDVHVEYGDKAKKAKEDYSKFEDNLETSKNKLQDFIDANGVPSKNDDKYEKYLSLKIEYEDLKHQDIGLSHILDQIEKEKQDKLDTIKYETKKQLK